MEFKFNHDSDDFFEAIGVTEEEMDAINKKIKKVMMSESGEEQTKSIIIEKMYKKLSKEELVIFTHILLEQSCSTPTGLTFTSEDMPDALREVLLSSDQVPDRVKEILSKKNSLNLLDEEDDDTI